MRKRPASSAPGAKRPSLRPRDEELRVVARALEDGVGRGAGGAATVWVANASLAAGAPQAGQNRLCSASSLPHVAHSGIPVPLYNRTAARRSCRIGTPRATDLTMSTRYKNGSHFENHDRASELQEGPAHSHNVAEHQGKQDHLSGPEHSRQALEHTEDGHRHSPGATVGHGVAAFGHNDIAALAFKLWKARGCPSGSPEEDWFRAVEELRSRAFGH
jgi:hypothetical protein